MLNELLQSRHYRLKILCFVLILYTLFHGQGLIVLISLHTSFLGNDNHLFDAAFVDYFYSFDGENSYGVLLSCILSLIAIVLFWMFAFAVILQYHYMQNDEKWMKQIKLVAYIGTIAWLLSIFSWIISIFFLFDTPLQSRVLLAVVPSWNKGLLISWIFSIFAEFNAVSRVKRVRQWIIIVSTFVGSYLLLLWLFAVAIGVSSLIVFAPVLTIVANMFVTLVEQLQKRGSSTTVYFVCVPCCCGCCVTNKWCSCCVPQRCIDHPWMKTVFWLVSGMTGFWFVASFIQNYNLCMALSTLLEYAFAFRSATVLIIFYDILICIELVYGQPIRGCDASTRPTPNSGVGIGTGIGGAKHSEKENEQFDREIAGNFNGNGNGNGNHTVDVDVDNTGIQLGVRGNGPNANVGTLSSNSGGAKPKKAKTFSNLLQRSRNTAHAGRIPVNDDSDDNEEPDNVVI